MNLKTTDSLANCLCCPTTKTPLQRVSLAELEQQVEGSLRTVSRIGFDAPTAAFGPELLASEAYDRIYPIERGFPVLLAPERLVSSQSDEVVDLRDRRYQEAYEELAHYNQLGYEMASRLDDVAIRDLMGDDVFVSSDPDRFPEPASKWIDARHDSAAQLDAYRYIAPLRDKVFLQLGGSGSHAVKALLAGSREAITISPMIGEAHFAMTLAERFGVADRLSCIVAIAEELPLEAESVDVVYSGGCVHHMQTELVFRELDRVLTPGGRFAAADPWTTLLHTIGTRVVGKREQDVHCRPIDHGRLSSLSGIFDDWRVSRHGPLLRYLFIAADKFGVRLPKPIMRNVSRLDDFWGARWGGSVFFGAQKRRTAPTSGRLGQTLK